MTLGGCGDFLIGFLLLLFCCILLFFQLCFDQAFRTNKIHVFICFYTLIYCSFYLNLWLVQSNLKAILFIFLILFRNLSQLGREKAVINSSIAGSGLGPVEFDFVLGESVRGGFLIHLFLLLLLEVDCVFDFFDSLILAGVVRVF